MDDEQNFPEILAGILLSDDDDLVELTMDDFFDFVGIPHNDPDNNLFYRTDFIQSAIVNQAEYLLTNIQ